MECSAILLAGGQCRRFGSDKTRLELDGRPLLETLAGHCRGLFDEVIVVGATPGKFSLPGVRELWDLVPGAGPLGGLHAGLTGCRFAHAFVSACDMPRFHPVLADRLARTALSSPGWDAVVPRDGQGAVQPLFAVYAKTALHAIQAQLYGESRAMKALLEGLRVRWLEEADWGVPPEQRGDLFANLNTPADLERLLREKE